MSDEKTQNEQIILDKLFESFSNIEGSVRRERRIELKVSKDHVRSVLLYAKEQLNFLHLSHISCVDWLEDNQFELIYILWSQEAKMQLFVKIMIDREKPVAPNIDYIWRQANTYEREIREMFGIEFTGLVGEQEFILEDWEGMPPMRRDFDTEAYAEETFFDRPGREDAKDVREEIIERSREELPDFAKKYSRD